MKIEKIRVLLIDDIEANLYSMKALIEKHFHVEILTTLSAEEALLLLIKEKIHIIISDIQMPKMDGFEFTRLLKTNSKTKNIPIIFVSASFVSFEDELKGLELGAIDYITKPVNEQYFILKLKNYIKLVTISETLREKEQYATKLLNLSDGAKIICDASCCVLDYNAKAKEIFENLSYEMDIHELADIELFQNMVVSILTNQHIFQYKRRTYKMVSKPLDGHYLLIIYDLTDEIKESKLQEIIFNNQDNIVLMIDGFHIKKLNNTFFEHFPFKDIEDFKSKHNCICELFIDKEGKKSLLPRMDGILWTQYLLENKSEIIYVYMLDKNNNEKIYEVKTSGQLHLGDDDIEEVIVFNDVTRIKQQEEILIQEQKYEKLFEYSQEPIGIINFEGKFLEINDAYAQMLGYSKEELKTKSCVELSSLKDLHRTTEILDKVKKEGSVKDFEKACIKKDGTIIVVMISMNLLPDEEKILVNVNDITHQNKIFKELFNAKLEAEKAAISQARFLANMSHEIRTPMNGILGFSRILRETLTKPEEKEYAFMIESSGDMLLEIINHILDISKIQSGNMLLDNSEFSIADEMEHIKKLYLVQANEKKITLHYTINERVKYLSCVSDVIKLKQVLSNLLNNAIKFTPQSGEIKFIIDLVEEQVESVLLRFIVKDNGIGITKEKQKEIFEPFRQENESTTREFGGTGLGLAISKELIHLLGGELTLESEKNVGSCFCFTLSLKKGKQLQPQSTFQTQTNSLQGKVLVAEDVEINQKLLRVLLSQQGLESSFASNGAEVVAIYQESYQEFDIVILDINMPVIDGVEALKQIRAFEKNTNIANIPVIALTANAIVGDKQRYLDNGFDDYLSKPINSNELKSVLEKYLAKGEKNV
jgi:PAS domain S-box-containing protein